MTALPPTGRTVHGLDGAGFVRDWLTGPVWSTPCHDLSEVLDSDGDPWGEGGRWVLTNGPDVGPLKRTLFGRRPFLVEQPLPDPVEGAAIRWQLGGVDGSLGTGNWRRAHTGTDGLLDWSRFCFTPEYRESLAVAVLEVDQAEFRSLEVLCTGPVAVFVDGALVGQYTDVSYMEPVRHRLPVRLKSGLTVVHLLTWQVAFREVRHVVGLRVIGLPVRVVVSTPGADEYVSASAEQLLDAVALGPWALTGDSFRVTGPPGGCLMVAVGDDAPRRVQLTDGTGEVSLSPAATGSDDRDLSGMDSSASMLSTGESVVTIRVDDPRAAVVREGRVAVLPATRRAASSVADPAVWRNELLHHVVSGAAGVARALGRHALDSATRLSQSDLEPPLAMIESRSDCADFEAIGFVHLIHRFASGDAWSAGQRTQVEDALLGLKYWIDQPGLDAMCYFTENHQLVWHTAELLAGELFAHRAFSNTGWPGSRHRDHGRRMALEWMRRKLTGGFSEFDSNAYLAIDSLALVSLVEYAEDVEIRQLAEVILDKVLFTLACNSWRGIHGAAHGRSYVPTLRSSRFEETAPIMWTLWGAGSLNAAVLPAVALATARCYTVPALIRAVATTIPEQWDGQQVYRGEYRRHHDLLSRPYGSDLRVWRTPDAMLSSVQNYRSGLPGLQEHIWGATLGPEVQVFATHPAADTNSASARPNAWAGQRVLPRVHQHQNSILVLHRYPDDDWANHTHLWFPSQQFDEWTTQDCWVAGRVGAGFVAVAAAGGLIPNTAGDEVGQCWRPVGDGRAYVVTVGRVAADGSFETFVESLSDPQFGRDLAGDPTVAWDGRGGHRLGLTWGGPFTVNGCPAIDIGPDGHLSDPPHLSNPACTQLFGADQLEAEWAGERMVLDLVAGRRLVPASGVARATGGPDSGGGRGGR